LVVCPAIMSLLRWKNILLFISIHSFHRFLVKIASCGPRKIPWGRRRLRLLILGNVSKPTHVDIASWRVQQIIIVRDFIDGRDSSIIQRAFWR
jgi:hypothetical protein